jgi:hypothetical protein
MNDRLLTSLIPPREADPAVGPRLVASIPMVIFSVLLCLAKQT